MNIGKKVSASCDTRFNRLKRFSGVSEWYFSLNMPAGKGGSSAYESLMMTMQTKRQTLACNWN
jgi:hypothetical protein